MASDVELPRPVRPDPISHGPNGRIEHHDDLRPPDAGNVVDRPPDPAGLREDLGTWDRLAMVVKSTGRWMRDSSIAEKAVAIFLAVIIGLLFNLNREVGEINTIHNSIESRIADHETRLREIERPR